MKNIYQYRNYREFLKDYYVDKKGSEQGFTYAKFAVKAKLKSPNYLKLIIDNKRNLTVSNIHAFAKCINIEGRELDFFEALVLENQAETKIEKSYYYRRIKHLKKSAGNREILRKSSNAKISDTSRVALKLFCEGKTHEQVLEQSSDELKISKQKAEEILDSLSSEGEVYLTPGDIYALKAKHVMNNDPKAFNLAQEVFLRDGLVEGQRIFEERYAKKTARFLSILFTARTSSLPHLFSDLREAFELVAKKYEPEANEADGVYRGQLQIYRFKKNEI